METALIKLKWKQEVTSRTDLDKIKTTFIKSCEKLDASIFEPLIDEDQYFQDLDKYRFLQSLKDEFDTCKRKGFTKTVMIESTCNGCHLGHKAYQFHTDSMIPAFAYIIHEEKDKIIDVFMCNHFVYYTHINLSKRLNHYFLMSLIVLIDVSVFNLTR